MKKIACVCIVLLLLSVSGSAIACTGFISSRNGTTLVGNNEDLSLLAEPLLKIIPPSTNGYGRVEFYCKWPYPFNTGSSTIFGGMNDQGLFFDIYSTPYHAITNPSNKPTYTQDIFAYCIRMCTTVDEVVAVFNRYYVPYMDEIQGFFVDKAGHSVIIEGNEMISKQGDFQVVTNFLQSQPELGGYPCWRYDTATDMLEQMTEFSPDYFTEICDAVHFEEVPLSTFMLDTIYSDICDLTNGSMYLYFFHDYAHVMEIKLPEIFDYGYQQYDLPSLFTPNASHSPHKPEGITGRVSGRINQDYEYSAIGTDDDNDLLFYYFDWGDGTNSGWMGYYHAGEPCTALHEWSEQGTYEIKVKTRDIYGQESTWSDPFPITMPYSFNSPLPQLFERFPNVFLLLRQLLG
jgi:choloylglycine hydrolase